jgi:hypothetical protein
VRSDGKQQRLAVGEALNGWTLESVDGSGANLSSARGGRERLALERVPGRAPIAPLAQGDSDAALNPSPAVVPQQAADDADELTLGGRR